MRTIYSHRKHRVGTFIGLALIAVFYGLYMTGCAIALIVSFKEPGFVLALALAGVGTWGVFWNVRYFLGIPREVTLLDGGQVQFVTRGGALTCGPGDFKAIRFVSGDESPDYLRVRAGKRTWYLPINPDEAEDFIREMSTLNPAIRIKGRG